MIGGHKSQGRQMGIASALYICEERGCPPRPVEEINLLAGLGVLGDIHADGGLRQISMISQETALWLEELKQQEKTGLCFKRYKANVRVEGLPVEGLLPGTKLEAGTALLTVSESAKECFPECVLFREGERCRLNSGCVFLKIEVTGNLRKGDKIVIIA